jgi:hypothetical protein
VLAKRIELFIPEGAGFTGPLHTPVADQLGSGTWIRTKIFGSKARRDA